MFRIKNDARQFGRAADPRLMTMSWTTVRSLIQVESCGGAGVLMLSVAESCAEASSAKNSVIKKYIESVSAADIEMFAFCIGY